MRCVLMDLQAWLDSGVSTTLPGASARAAPWVALLTSSTPGLPAAAGQMTLITPVPSSSWMVLVNLNTTVP